MLRWLPLLAVSVCACDAGDDTHPADRGYVIGQPRVHVTDVYTEPGGGAVGAAEGFAAPGVRGPREGGSSTPTPFTDEPLPPAWDVEAVGAVATELRRRVVASEQVVGVVPDGAGQLLFTAGGGRFAAGPIGSPRPLHSTLGPVERVFGDGRVLVACAAGGPARVSVDRGERWARLGFACPPGGAASVALDGARSYALTAEGLLRVGALPTGTARRVSVPVAEPRVVAAFGEVVLVFGADGLARSEDGGAGFGHVELPGRLEVLDARFVGKSTVVAVGRSPLDAPRVLTSADPGQTWRLGGDLPRRATELGWLAVDRKGTLLATPREIGGVGALSRDDGETWAPLERTPVLGAALGVREGFVAGSPVGLWRAVDGRPLPTLGLSRPLWAAAFTHPRVAVGAGLDGGLFRTVDGGRTWGKARGTDGIVFWDVSGLGDHRVVAVGDGLLWRSDDAGGRWSAAPPPSSCRARWVRFEGLAGLVGCADGQILRSLDGAATFEVAEVLPFATRPAAWIEGRAVALSADGARLVWSDDRGESWQDSSAPPGAVELAPGGDGLTLLAGGALLTAGADLGFRAVRTGLRGFHAHRLLPGERLLLLDGSGLWVADGSAQPRRVASVPAARAARPTGDGGLLLLGPRETTLLEPR